MQISFVRRLDELGRIVIPKEVRNKLNFNSGDLLDLNIGNEALIIKKNNSSFNKQYVNEIINLVEYLTKVDILITNNEKIIATSRKLGEDLINTRISRVLKKLIEEHKSNEYNNGVNITENFYLDKHVFVKVLIKDSNTLGLLVLRVNEDEIKDMNLFLNIVTNLLLQ